ncbi:MAG: phosphoenolpyruvate--protein phosphotransferase [Bacteroidales bacterium]|nr:phosphoenolpyruvate--protein phosphotransferase [Bacteroidales bacterium]
MKDYKGEGIVDGIAIGHIVLYRRPALGEFEQPVQDTAAELARFRQAWQQADNEMALRYEKAQALFQKDRADIFAAQKLMLEDQEFIGRVEESILHDKRTAVYAVLQTSEFYADVFLGMEDELMRSKSADIRDVSSMLVRCLCQGENERRTETPGIVVADYLLPGDLMEMGQENLLGIIVRHGSASSHLAILATEMNLPMIVCPQLELNPDLESRSLAMDGGEGLIFIDPDSSTITLLKEKNQELIYRRQVLASTGEVLSYQSHRIELLANIGSIEDLRKAVANGCDGIGLFRTELSFLGCRRLPREEELTEYYRQCLDLMPDRQLVFRTLDIGSDKQIPGLSTEKESNPALGCRGIRFCLSHPELFKMQLRALLRAAVKGRAALMFPMITSLSEVIRAKALLQKAAAELKEAGLPYRDDLPLGVMIETPAAVMLADELAREVNFMSIGSNDLAQYTLAADRENEALAAEFGNRHPAVMKMIGLTVEAARRQGVGLSLCGELGHDLEALPELLQLGLTRFSVSPAHLPAVKAKIRQICKP